MNRTVVPWVPASILVSAAECDRWNDDLALRTEVEGLARQVKAERGGWVQITTESGYMVDVWCGDRWQSA
jgi:hypothetical protein